MNKLSSFATIFGIGMVALNSAIYTVDPGEKALIMDKLQGLKQDVYSQGYHLLIPGIQVLYRSNPLDSHHLRLQTQTDRHPRRHRYKGLANCNNFVENLATTHRRTPPHHPSALGS